MTGAVLDFRFDGLDEARAVFDSVVAAGGNTRELMELIGEGLLSSTQERFEDSMAPDGTPWSPSRRVIEAVAAGDDARTLIDSQNLLDSQARQSGDDWARVGTPLPYGAVHQFGGRAGQNLAAEIVARPYLGVSADDETMILDEAADFLDSVLAAKGAQP